MSPEELVERCIKKDSSAWNEFVRLYEDLVCRSISHKLGKMNAFFACGDKEDISQDIFFSLWKSDSLSKLRKKSSIRGWLSKVAANRAVSHLRKRINEKPSTYPVEECSMTDGLSRDSIENKEAMAILAEEVNRLSRKEKRLLKMRVYDESTYKDIAEKMDIPVNTLTSLLTRAKKKIRKNMKSYYQERS